MWGRSLNLQVELGATPLCLHCLLKFLSIRDRSVDLCLFICVSPVIVCEFLPGMDSAFLLFESLLHAEYNEQSQ